MTELLDLSRSTELRTLVFDDWFMSHWTPRDWSVQVLRKIRSDRLRSITFRFRCYNAKLLPWDETAPFLNNLSFPEIQVVRFENHAQVPPKGLAQDRLYILNRLPALAVRNLVDCTTIPERFQGVDKLPWRLLTEGAIESCLYIG